MRLTVEDLTRVPDEELRAEWHRLQTRNENLHREEIANIEYELARRLIEGQVES